MKARLVSLLCALTLALTFAIPALAAEVTEAEVPVTLTIINTERKISVTVPAALPVSVVDGGVVTATNAAITNQAESGSIRVTAVAVKPGRYAIGDYENFSGWGGAIALSVNGCPARGAGALTLQKDAFPDIAPGRSLAIRYDAKVSVSGKADGVTAAMVVFTIEAIN